MPSIQTTKIQDDNSTLKDPARAEEHKYNTQQLSDIPDRLIQLGICINSPNIKSTTPYVFPFKMKCPCKILMTS